MRLKLTVAGAATPAGTIDLDIEAPVDLTVGELATELAERSPHHNPPAATLAISRTGVAARPIDPSVAVRDTDIASGMTVELVAPGVPVAPGRDTAPTAVAIVTAGPDTGRRFPLFSGANIVGREASRPASFSFSWVSGMVTAPSMTPPAVSPGWRMSTSCRSSRSRIASASCAVSTRLDRSTSSGFSLNALMGSAR